MQDKEYNSIKPKKVEREHSVDLPDNDKKNTKNIGQFILGKYKHLKSRSETW